MIWPIVSSMATKAKRKLSLKTWSMVLKILIQAIRLSANFKRKSRELKSHNSLVTLSASSRTWLGAMPRKPKRPSTMSWLKSGARAIQRLKLQLLCQKRSDSSPSLIKSPMLKMSTIRLKTSSRLRNQLSKRSSLNLKPQIRSSRRHLQLIQP